MINTLFSSSSLKKKPRARFYFKKKFRRWQYFGATMRAYLVLRLIYNRLCNVVAYKKRFQYICAYIIFKKNYKPNFLVILFSEAGMVAFVFACIVLHFPSKPKHPPSITSTMERTAFLPSVISICTNPQVGIYHLIHPSSTYDI